MNLCWLEQVEADVPTGNDWLSPWEAARLDSFRVAKRRADWRLGRWTAKQAIAFCLNLTWDAPTLTTIEIRPTPSGVPEAFLNHGRAPLSISLSHREGRAMCAIARVDVRVGCDLERIEPHSDAFLSDYFTPAEQRSIGECDAGDRDRRIALLWSAKESALKALHEGLRLDTRTVAVTLDPKSPNLAGWGEFEVRYGGDVFRGWWQQADNLVRTMVADRLSPPPIRLPIISALNGEFAPELAAPTR